MRALPSNIRWGGKAHPRPRQRRMQLDEKNKQLPAVASITHRPVSGQASSAGRTVRTAHSESQADRPENECIHFPAGFLAFICPETRLACFKFQAQIVCFLFQAGSPGWVQGAKSPGSGARGLKKPSNVSLPPLNSSLLMINSYQSTKRPEPFAGLRRSRRDYSAAIFL